MPFAKSKKMTCRKSNDLKPKECCAHAVAALDQHLPLSIQGKLTQTTLFQALVGMTAMQHRFTRSPGCWSVCPVKHPSAITSRNSISMS